MYKSCLDVQKKVLAVLQNNPVLSGYVKEFSSGGEQKSRMIFPYVSVVDVNSNAAPQSIGAKPRAMYHYNITIQTGTNSLAPEIAHAGNNEGKKGIIQLNDDVVNALYPGTLDNTFARNMKLANCSMSQQSGGRTWTGTIHLSGFISA